MEDLTKIFTDTELTISHLKNILADNGIESMLRNDFESGVSAGFVAGAPNSVDLYVFSKDVAKAKPVVDKFVSELKK
jgi:SRSO17 transposase